MNSLKIILASAIIAILVTGLVIPSIAFADVISPVKQMKLNFSTDEVICQEGFFRVLSVAHNTPACVKINSVNKLVSMGWAQPVDQSLLQMRMAGELQTVGTVKILAKVKISGDSGRLDSSPTQVGYNVVFEACAKSTVRAPEVIVVSDSESKRVKLSEKIDANTCQVSAVKIKTGNSESIKASMTNKGGISEKITSLENKIANLKETLSTERKKLSTVQEGASPGEIESMAAKNIAQLRKDIIKSSDELNRYKFALYVKPSQISSLNSKSFSDSAIDGASITKLATKKSNNQPIDQPKNTLVYNAYFQICAKDIPIHAPEVLVTSDLKTKSVRLANDISSNSCQRNSVEISAEKQGSISISLKNKGEMSASIDNLEKKVTDLQEKIRMEKEKLTNLVLQSSKAQGYEKQVNELTDKIVMLRTDLNTAKANLFKLLSTK